MSDVNMGNTVTPQNNPPRIENQHVRHPQGWRFLYARKEEIYEKALLYSCADYAVIAYKARKSQSKIMKQGG